MGNNKGQEMRFSEAELEIIRATFKDKTDLLKLLRKVFLPEYDPHAPLGQVIDLWMTIPIQGMTPEDILRRIYARNEVIVHVESQLQQLHALANMKEETKEEKEKRLKKDSTR